MFLVEMDRGHASLAQLALDSVPVGEGLGEARWDVGQAGTPVGETA
jgi:hypothetical protein